MSAAIEVRRARAQDIPELAAMLARAFLDDPVATWVWRPDRLRLSALRRFQAARLRQLLRHEDVWTTDDLSCAALWAPPAHWHKSIREELELGPAFIHPLLMARMPLAAAGWMNMERSHPRSPEHYYLAVLGTDPSAQGRGLGSRVLAQMLDQCDRDGIGAFLECSKERNVDFYARHGFRVTLELKLLRGPPIWLMWRDPRG